MKKYVTNTNGTKNNKKIKNKKERHGDKERERRGRGQAGVDCCTGHGWEGKGKEGTLMTWRKEHLVPGPLSVTGGLPFSHSVERC